MLDSSVTMAWCFEDEADGCANEVLGALTDGTAFFTAIWPIEVAKVLPVAESRGRLAREGRESLALLRCLPVRTVLAQARGLSTFDAACLEFTR